MLAKGPFILLLLGLWLPVLQAQSGTVATFDTVVFGGSSTSFSNAVTSGTVLIPQGSTTVSFGGVNSGPIAIPSGSTTFTLVDSSTTNLAALNTGSASLAQGLTQGTTTVSFGGVNSGTLATGTLTVATGTSSVVLSSGGLTSDPILQGFDNSTFEFCGQPGHNYTLIATPSLTINMALVAAGSEHIRPQGGQGTFAGGMAVMLASSTLIATVDKKGNMSLSVDGNGVDMEQPNAWGNITYMPYVPDKGQVVTVTEPPFKFSIVAVKQYVDVESGYNRGHLDLAAEITSPVMSTVSGVLGQTLTAYTSMDESEFEVPALTHASQVSPHIRRSRILLAESLSGVFPLRASMSSDF